MTVAATDKSGARYQLGLAIGDKVRLFDRVHDANTRGRDQVLANNGSVVEIMALNAKGMTIRNDEGNTGLVAWSKIRDRVSDPVRLTLGYATTLNLAQGITSTEHVHASLDGSKSMNAYSAYVAMSRHKEQAWLILNEGAIRQQIASKHVDGSFQPIRSADVWRRAGSDMNRKPERGSAIEMLERVTDAKRGGIAAFQRGMEPGERRAQKQNVSLTAFEDRQLAPIVKHVLNVVKNVTLFMPTSRHQPMHEQRGPSSRL